MKKTTIKTETFRLNNYWLIDVVTTKDTYEAYLYRNNEGIKTFVFGILKKDYSYENALRIFETEAPDYCNGHAKDIEILDKAIHSEFFR